MASSVKTIGLSGQYALSGISYDEKTARINVTVQNKSEYVLAEDLNQIKESINNNNEAISSFGNEVKNEIEELNSSIENTKLTKVQLKTLWNSILDD